MKTSAFLISLCGMISVTAGELIQNGFFTEEARHWTLSPSPEAGLDPLTAAEVDKTQFIKPGTASIKLSKSGKDALPWRPYAAQKDIKLKPDTLYEASCYFKCENVEPFARLGGVGLRVTCRDKSMQYGTEGMWKQNQGTMDWTQIRFQFNSNYFEENVIAFSPTMLNATGTAWFTALSLKEANTAKEKEEAAYQIDVFPLNFLRTEPFGVCENLPAALEIRTEGSNKPENLSAAMILEVPEFIIVHGVVEKHPVVRNGKRAYLLQKMTESKITRDSRPYRRYRIDFNELFTRIWNADWYTQFIHLGAAEGTRGQQGQIYWTFQFDGRALPESTAGIRVLPPVAVPQKAAQKFRLMLYRTPSPAFPIPEVGAKMLAYWTSLARRPLVMEDYFAPYSQYEPGTMIFGNDLMFSDHKTREWLSEYQKNAPKDITDTGRINPKPGSSNWYKLDDPDKGFENYLRRALRQWASDWPDKKILVWDFEPHPYGYDDGGRERFARQMRLAKTPDIEEIKQNYSEQWFDYMVDLHARVIAKVAKIFKEELPDREFWLCSDNMYPGPRKISAWCGVDVSRSDAVLDGHMHMPYYAGTRYFDDVDFNIRNLKKPFFPLNDPAERLWSFFRQYTPLKIRQNIIATAALGGKGFGFWPDDTLSGEYFHQIASAYGDVARVEDFYFNGKRVDEEFKFTPRNVRTKEITGDGGPMNSRKGLLTFPDFSRTLRTVAHEKDGKYVFTLFNYHEKEELLLEISGRDLQFLLKIPPHGVRVVHSAQQPDQSILQNDLKNYQAKNRNNDIFREVAEGTNSIRWGISANGAPALKMSDGKNTLDIDAAGGSEITALRNAAANELVQGGFLGKVILLDPGQPGCNFILSDIAVRNNIPSVSSTAAVPPFDGANPEANPLLDLQIIRTYELKDGLLEIRITFKNPTANAMKFAFRLNNYPRPGLRFGMKNLEVSTGGEKVTPRDGADNLFVKTGRQIAFGRNMARQTWDGGEVAISAGDEMLQDKLTHIPDPGFAGVYVWNDRTSMTVELISEEITLEPGQSREFTCRIKFNNSH